VNTTALPDKLTNLITQPLVLVVIIVVVAAACIATTFQRLTLPLSQQSASTQPASNANINTGLSSAEIIALNVFGTTSVVAQTQQNHQDIPETKLRLILKGAFSHRDQKQASALIASDQVKRAELFMVGDELPGNAILEEVYASYVVLKRGIQLEKLQFSRNLDDNEKNNQTKNGTPAVTGQVTSYETQKSNNESRAAQPVVTDETATSNSNASKSTADFREMIRQRD